MQVGKARRAGEKGPCSSGHNTGKRTVPEKQRPTEGRRKQASLSVDYEKPSESAEEEPEIMLWSNNAKDLASNLAKGVFKKDGAEEASRKTAAAIARRIELMTRCYIVLHVSLQDIIEGKVRVAFCLGRFSSAIRMLKVMSLVSLINFRISRVLSRHHCTVLPNKPQHVVGYVRFLQASICMLTGENDAEVTESCLSWLKETTNRKVAADWAKREEDVSQVSVFTPLSDLTCCCLGLPRKRSCSSLSSRPSIGRPFVSHTVFPCARNRSFILQGNFLHKAVNRTRAQGV